MSSASWVLLPSQLVISSLVSGWWPRKKPPLYLLSIVQFTEDKMYGCSDPSTEQRRSNFQVTSAYICFRSGLHLPSVTNDRLVKFKIFIAKNHMYVTPELNWKAHTKGTTMYIFRSSTPSPSGSISIPTNVLKGPSSWPLPGRTSLMCPNQAVSD